MVATRSLQLTVKKTTRSMKTLEGQLLMVKNGERIAVSSRVAELDQIIPQYLGVSRAVLDNVIFCHQDESLWPMSEPSVLKKKFDEIFEALKYTKAVENIKVLRKKQGEELQKFKIIEEHAKDDKNKGDKAEKRAQQLSDNIEGLRARTIELDDQVKVAAKKAEDAWDHCSQFERIVAQLEGKRIEARAKEESVTSLRQHIQEMSDSDEQLTSMLERYEERAELYQDEINSCRQSYDDLSRDLEDTRSKHSDITSERGRLQGQKDNFDRQVQNREDVVKETARRHNIRGFDHQLDDKQVRDFMERIIKLARDQNTALERARKDIQQETQKTLEGLNRLNERKSALNQSKDNTRQQMTVTENKIARSQIDLNRINADEGAKAIMETNIRDVEGKLSTLRQKFEDDQWDKKNRENDADMRASDDLVESLNNELIRATEFAGATARADVVTKSLKDSQLSLKTMTGAHGPTLTKLLGPDWNSKDLEHAFQQKLEERQQDLKATEQQRDGVSRELEQTEFRLSTITDDLASKQKELERCRNDVSEAIGEDEDPAEYNSIRQDLENNRDVLKGDSENFTNLSKYYEDSLKALNNSNVCRLCERSMRTDKEKTKFAAKLEKLLSNAQKEVVEEELKSLEADLKRVKEASPAFDAWTRLREVDIPKLREESTRIQATREVLIGRLEEQDRAVDASQSLKRDVDALSKTIQSMLKYTSEIAQYEKQLAELKSQDSQAGRTRGLEEIRDQLARVNSESRENKSRQAKLSADKENARALISSLELELSNANAKLNTTMYQLKEKQTIADQVEELKEVNKQAKISIGEFDNELQQLNPKISETQAVLDEISRRGLQREKALQDEATKLTNSVNQLKVVEQDINAYVDRDGPQQLARVKRELEQVQQELVRIENEMKLVTKNLNKVTDQARNHAETKRSIADNLRYRRDLKTLHAVQGEIEQLEAHNAEADRNKYQREADRWSKERSKLAAELASLIGQMKSMDDQLEELLKAYEIDYKDAAANYKEAHIKVEASKAAVEDLGRYGGALDKAIMKYHSLKMEEINRIIEELWKKTYQGTDVDSIMIRSENENDKGNKSYNYRVVFVKSDVEMDMRGRCSAGQKVLASIIIRLALAECFGVNCGLIALDEPTTNLDVDNIRSLAQSLHDIIKSRQQQSNFQLIVITHDEEFLRYMQCTDFSDYYYRISRNERQKSIIERQLISEVM